jgi:hypothetical protein
VQASGVIVAPDRADGVIVHNLWTTAGAGDSQRVKAARLPPAPDGGYALWWVDG